MPPRPANISSASKAFDDSEFKEFVSLFKHLLPDPEFTDLKRILIADDKEKLAEKVEERVEEVPQVNNPLFGSW